VIKNIARVDRKGVSYKVVDFVGRVAVMNAKELCQDAQEKPKVFIREESIWQGKKKPATKHGK
jgi:hypothetical protein